MKIFLVIYVSLAVGGASVIQFSPSIYSAGIPLTTQYHAQDSFGQYSYGYSGGPSAKSEYKSLDGVTRGSYSYVDSNGELQTVEYTADSANGFQASATNLPKAPVDDKVPPKPVEDTPEVAMAKAKHFAAMKEAALKAAEDPTNGDENGNSDQDEEGNGSQERQATMSQDSTSSQTETSNGLVGSSEPNSQESEKNGSSRIAANGNGDTNGNRNDNGNGNGNGKENGNGNVKENGDGNGSNGITRVASNGVSNVLGLSGFGSSLSSSRSALNLNDPLNQLTPSGLNALSSLQLSGDIPSGFGGSIDAFRFSEITPATTSELLPVPLTSVQLPSTSYLRVSTPTHAYSIVSPTVLTAVPTLGSKSIQTIGRPLPIPLTSTFLTQGLQ